MSIWTKHQDSFVTEISTLEHTGMKCAHCGYGITLGQPQRDKSGEIMKWDHTCRECGTKMIIFND